MGFGGAVSRCKAALGSLTRVAPGRPGAARPAASRPPAKPGQQLKVPPRSAGLGVSASNPRKMLYTAKRDEFVDAKSFQGTLPQLGDMDPAPPLKKTPERLVTEASAEEEATIQRVWDTCTKVLSNKLDTNAALSEVQTTLHAAPTGLPFVWPFQGSSSHITNLACSMYSIPDLLHAAHHKQRVQHILPIVQDLLLAASAIHPNQCPVLHETLSLLVDVHPQLPRNEQDMIASILGCWNLHEAPMQADLLVWTDQQSTSWWRPGMSQADSILPGSGIILFGVGQMQHLRPSTFDTFPAALQPSQTTQPYASHAPATSSTTSQRLNPEIEKGLYTQTAMTAAVEAARQEEQQKAKAALDKAHTQEQHALAQAKRECRSATRRAVAFAIAKSNLDKNDKITVLETLSEQPSDVFMMKAYYERHTNVFHFDFNGLMRQRRKERLTAESMQTEDFDDGDASDSM